MMNIIKIQFILLFLVFTPGCTIDSSGLAGDMEISVFPEYFCPGDTVTVRWDVRNDIPKSTALCTSCVTNADCDGTGKYCLDAVCTYRGFPSDAHPECASTFDMTIEGDTLPDPGVLVSTISEVSGANSLTPTGTTTFNARGAYFEPSTYRIRKSVVATEVRPSPPTAIELKYQLCSNGTPTYPVYDVTTLGPTTASNVRITEIQNPTHHLIEVRSSVIPESPITLNPGESFAYSGRVEGSWAVTLSPLDRQRVSNPSPMCSPVDSVQSWDDLTLSLRVECAVE